MRDAAGTPVVIEPFDLPEEYVSGLASVEILSGGEIRFIFYSEKRGERVAKLALIMPSSAAFECVSMTSRGITDGKSCELLGPCLAMNMKRH